MYTLPTQACGCVSILPARGLETRLRYHRKLDCGTVAFVARCGRNLPAKRFGRHGYVAVASLWLHEQITSKRFGDTIYAHHGKLVAA